METPNSGESCRQQPASPAVEALTQQVWGYTLRIVDLTDPSYGGTAVGIRIGPKAFLATADHVLVDGHRREAVARGEKWHLDSFAALHRDRTRDVALLEVRASQVELCSSHLLDIRDVRGKSDPSASWKAVVQGYPGDLIKLVQRERIPPNWTLATASVGGFAFLTQSMPKQKWPTEGLEDPADESWDIFLDFDPGPPVAIQKACQEPAYPPPNVDWPPPPQGLSGGGIWIPTARRSVIWEPHCVLAGLVVSAMPSRSWIRGKQMWVWLELVGKHYPGLARDLGQAANRGVP